jgi:hypothetical protein
MVKGFQRLPRDFQARVPAAPFWLLGAPGALIQDSGADAITNLEHKTTEGLAH